MFSYKTAIAVINCTDKAAPAPGNATGRTCYCPDGYETATQKTQAAQVRCMLANLRLVALASETATSSHCTAGIVCFHMSHAGTTHAGSSLAALRGGTARQSLVWLPACRCCASTVALCGFTRCNQTP